VISTNGLLAVISVTVTILFAIIKDVCVVGVIVDATVVNEADTKDPAVRCASFFLQHLHKIHHLLSEYLMLL
jgi:hypothetical protein